MTTASTTVKLSGVKRHIPLEELAMGLLVLAALLGPGAAGNGAQARQSAGFFRVEGTKVLDGQGKPAMKRGIGLGGWLMPEGYMLHFPGTGSLTAMNNQIRGLIGEADAARFWQIYRDNYVEEKDIAALAAAGFDHVRLPFHYNVVYDLASRSFKPEGFELLDRFIGWCRKYGLYVILDLHAAPGAQNDGPISDSDGTARLWTEPSPYQGITVSIWGELARRYANETQIIGYDLLNEPVTPSSIPDGAKALRDFYGLLVSAVRSVDTNHIVFIEGNYYATTFDKLTPPFDSKMVYAFHKYWNPADTGTIWYLLAIRDTYRVPLWLGETGENSNAWFKAVVDLMDEHDIGWNWWTHKKIQATTSPWSARIKPGYRAVLNYFGGSGARPSAQAARDALFEMAEGLDLDSTDFDKDVMASLMDPGYGSSQRPWVDHVIPGVVNAADYDSGLPGDAYSDEDVWAVSGSPGGGNRGGRYRNDGVDIEASSDPRGFAYNVGWLEPGEWMEYTVWVETAGLYDVEFRLASLAGGGSMSLQVDGAPVATVPVPRTGGWQSWMSVEAQAIHLREGYHPVRVTVGATGDFNFNRMIFELVTPDDPEAARLAGRPKLYPNPVQTELMVRLPASVEGPVRILLFDMLGRVVLDRTWDASGSRLLEIPTENLARGVMGYRITYNDEVATGSFVRQ